MGEGEEGKKIFNTNETQEGDAEGGLIAASSGGPVKQTALERAQAWIGKEKKITGQEALEKELASALEQIKRVTSEQELMQIKYEKLRGDYNALQAEHTDLSRKYEKLLASIKSMFGLFGKIKIETI